MILELLMEEIKRRAESEAALAKAGQRLGLAERAERERYRRQRKRIKSAHLK
jgi:hypothetical protein